MFIHLYILSLYHILCFKPLLSSFKALPQKNICGTRCCSTTHHIRVFGIQSRPRTNSVSTACYSVYNQHWKERSIGRRIYRCNPSISLHLASCFTVKLKNVSPLSTILFRALTSQTDKSARLTDLSFFGCWGLDLVFYTMYIL